MFLISNQNNKLKELIMLFAILSGFKKLYVLL